MANKSFKTIDEQVFILTSRGMSITNDTKMLLQREGYYSLVNGYKDPFLISRSPECFLPNTSFNDLYRLFIFDRKLRECFFPYLIQAEATIKNSVVYVFTKHHSSHSSYCDGNCFCSETEYYQRNRGLIKTYEAELKQLIQSLQRTVNFSNAIYIRH